MLALLTFSFYVSHSDVFFTIITVYRCTDVRLVGSSMSNQGRLEVNFFGIWGTVCDDDFDDIDAGVVCNSLGYGYSLICWLRIAQLVERRSPAGVLSLFYARLAAER